VNAQNILDIDTVSVPNKFSNICRLIQDNLPVITLREFYDSEQSFEKYVQERSYRSITYFLS